MSFDLTTEDQGENKQSWLECKKKGWEGKGKGMGFRVGWGCLRARARVWSWGVQVWVSGLKVQGKGFRQNGSGFRDE